VLTLQCEPSSSAAGGTPIKSCCTVTCSVHIGKWINICWLHSLKTLGGAIRQAERLSSLVFTVVLISGSGQVDATKDLWERNLGAIVGDRRRDLLQVAKGTSIYCFGLFIRKLTLPLAEGC
jgi:hypothetical protein